MGKVTKIRKRMKRGVTLIKEQSMDTSLKLALVELKWEPETGAEMYLRDTRCSSSESQ